jgi:hypothetical protein
MRRTVFARLAVPFFRHPMVSTVCFELILLVGLGVIGYYNPGNLGTLIALALRYAIFPLLGSAFVLWVCAGFEAGPRRSRLQTVVGLCFLTPVVAVRAYYVDSIYLVLYYEALWPVIFLALAFGFAWGAYGMPAGRLGTECSLADGRTVVRACSGSVFQGSQRQNAAATVFIALIMIFLAWASRRPFLVDATQCQDVEGTITYLKAHERSGRRSTIPEYQVRVDQHVYAATREVFLNCGTATTSEPRQVPAPALSSVSNANLRLPTVPMSALM